MPSLARSKLWYVRVTAPWDHIKAKAKEMKGWVDYTGSFVGYHTGDKTKKQHAHIALKLSSELQKQSLDTRMKKLFGVERSDYSSKPWDGEDDALAYMYHDKEALIDQDLVSEDKIPGLKARNDDIQKIVSKAKEHASNRVVDHVLTKIRESGITWNDYDIGYEIQKAIYQGLFYDPGDFVLERYINEILCKQCTSEDELHRMFASRWARLKISRPL